MKCCFYFGEIEYMIENIANGIITGFFAISSSVSNNCESNNSICEMV